MKVGDTYVVTVDGTFYTETVEVGDTLICQTAANAGSGSLSITGLLFKIILD